MHRRALQAVREHEAEARVPWQGTSAQAQRQVVPFHFLAEPVVLISVQNGSLSESEDTHGGVLRTVQSAAHPLSNLPFHSLLCTGLQYRHTPTDMSKRQGDGCSSTADVLISRCQ